MKIVYTKKLVVKGYNSSPSPRQLIQELSCQEVKRLFTDRSKVTISDDTTWGDDEIGRDKYFVVLTITEDKVKPDELLRTTPNNPE